MDSPTSLEPVEVQLEDRRWKDIGLDRLANRAYRVVMSELGMTGSAPGFSLMATDDARIAELNGQFRNRPSPTNVLSWPASDDSLTGEADAFSGHAAWHWSGSLGDIAIAYDTCASEASASGKTLCDHVTHLLIHAILHLLGYRHDDEADARAMQAIEISALAKLGIGDPY